MTRSRARATSGKRSVWSTEKVNTSSQDRPASWREATSATMVTTGWLLCRFLRCLGFLVMPTYTRAFNAFLMVSGHVECWCANHCHSHQYGNHSLQGTISSEDMSFMCATWSAQQGRKRHCVPSSLSASGCAGTFGGATSTGACVHIHGSSSRSLWSIITLHAAELV